jgi:hypothetical protein
MMSLMNPKRRTVPPLHRPIPTVLNLKPGGAILKSFDYQRDANGMVISVDREDPTWNRTTLYDNRLQLQGASYGFPSWMNELYFYDGRGNRMEKRVDGEVADAKRRPVDCRIIGDSHLFPSNIQLLSREGGD